MRVRGRRVVVAALAAVTVGVAGVAAAGIAQAASATCDGRVMKAGAVDTTVQVDATVREVYGEAAVPARGSSPACRLTRGDSTGTDVAASPVYWLQLTLNECYGAGLVLDGNYGSRTRAAVMVVQRGAGMGADGVYGPDTRDRMSFFVRRTGRGGGTKSACIPYYSLL